jgi:predicted nucleic acid-binding protein
VQSKRIVIDANILVRAVLGVRVRELIERYCDSAESRWLGSVNNQTTAAVLNSA